ncbi:MAG: VC0807 family protein [Acidimicrobiales bacterium]
MHKKSTPLQLPGWRAVARHALPNVLEGKIIPLIVFLGLLKVVGTTSALVGALAWSLVALVRRHRQQRQSSGILVLTTVGLAARTVAALLTGSLVVYFIQPTVATGLVAAAFLGSVLVGRPLVERLFADLFPLDAETRHHPQLRRFYNHASLWWAFTSAVNFAVTVWLLLNHSPTTFIVVKSFLGPVTTALTLSVAYWWLRSSLARSGTAVMLAPATVHRR